MAITKKWLMRCIVINKEEIDFEKEHQQPIINVILCLNNV